MKLNRGLAVALAVVSVVGAAGCSSNSASSVTPFVIPSTTVSAAADSSTTAAGEAAPDSTPTLQVAPESVEWCASMTAVATELSKPSATTDALKAKVATIRSLYRKVIDVAPASAADISKAMLHAIDDLSTMLDPVGYDVAKAPQARIDAQMAEDQANADVLQPYGVATCGPTFGSPAG